jgi:DNA-binding Xre family transcriptional regulator
MIAKNKNIGSDFDDFLREEGTLEATEATAIKRVIAHQLAKTMHSRHMTKASMARRMHTSRSAVERLFDPENGSVTLFTLNRAATALGKKLKVELV